MFNKETLTAMFKGKEFGYGKWLIYFYAADDFVVEEADVDIEVLDGVIKITNWETNEDTHERIEKGDTSCDYIPFEKIERISFIKDF